MSTPEIDLENHLRELERADELSDEVERRLFPGDKAWEAMYAATTLEEFLEARAQFEEVLDNVGELFYPEH